jgi:hypothetical protein
LSGRISPVAPFDRRFFSGREKFTAIGHGELGGKARGLALIKDVLAARLSPRFQPRIEIGVPTLTVITTEMFDLFMSRNNLREAVAEGLRDDQIASLFLNAELPAQLVGDLRALVAQVHSPLAVRSSSLLEDAMFEPFASVYATKMIPNNQFDTDLRFRKLVEAIKLVYASTFFKDARHYIRATRHATSEEKMAVIIQEVIGQRHGPRFYPHLSGVARSYNFYPLGHSRPSDGVIDLALGLGRTIVDDGVSWSYSPAFPQANPPYNTLEDLLAQTQSEFWAINMRPPATYRPFKETEYMMKYSLKEAEADGVLVFLASTYRACDDKIVYGIADKGPRLVDFAPILKFDLLPLNKMLKDLLGLCEETLERLVEIEFALTIESRPEKRGRFGFLQVRPMVVSEAPVRLAAEDLHGPNVVLASESVLGNGFLDDIRDIVFVKPERFNVHFSEAIAGQLEAFNNRLLTRDRPYVLIGFGRWGTSDPQAGIPVNFGQINGARVIVEQALPDTSSMLSQGSHFFHNITSFKVLYFSLDSGGPSVIDWEWLNGQRVVEESEFVRHVETASPLTIKVDGTSGRGVILH